MSPDIRKRELGRGERVLPGLWRLRLPLPWPGIPHVNAWAVAAGNGVVLFDCGMYEPGSIQHLELALSQVGLRLEHVRLLAVTHAHVDHCGQARSVTERADCELWMHPRYEHMVSAATEPDVSLDRLIEVARTSGVPERSIAKFEQGRRGTTAAIDGIVTPARELVNGTRIETDLGGWDVYETPGHAPSHVSFYQPESRILISGDHLLGRVSPYFERGFSADPVAEFLHSLDLTTELDARLCLSGHGRTFTDIPGHIEANRKIVRRRIEKVLASLADRSLTAFELIPRVFGDEGVELSSAWHLNETICYLEHLELRGDIERHLIAPSESAKPLERWAYAT